MWIISWHETFLTQPPTHGILIKRINSELLASNLPDCAFGQDQQGTYDNAWHPESIRCCPHYFCSSGVFLLSAMEAGAPFSPRQTCRLTSFLFLQLNGLGCVPDRVLSKAKERLVKIALSHFFEEENTLNDFILQGGFNAREGKMPHPQHKWTISDSIRSLHKSISKRFWKTELKDKLIFV